MFEFSLKVTLSWKQVSSFARLLLLATAVLI
jgi:hypothetical protein